MKKDTKNLFQISEAARACGLSRSTLMRMEEKGLLTPAYVSPTSGQRYYDNFNVARILQVEKFKAMGLDTEEIADYFARGGEAFLVGETRMPAHTAGHGRQPHHLYGADGTIRRAQPHFLYASL